MSSILSEAADVARTELTDDGARSSILRVVELVEETDADGERRAVARSLGRPYLLVDLKAALDYVRGNRGTATEAVEAVERGAEEVARRPTGDANRGRDGGESDGRGVLSKVFLLGIALGVGYAVRKQSGSVGETVGKATDRARDIADKAEMRSGEVAGEAERVTDETADRIEERGGPVAEEAADRVRDAGETAADSVQEGGEMAADRMDEAADAAEDAEQRAEETAGSGTDGDDQNAG